MARHCNTRRGGVREAPQLPYGHPGPVADRRGESDGVEAGGPGLLRAVLRRPPRRPRGDLPIFDQPKPVPESFQHKVIEVFRRCGSREIPAKNFRDMWNCFFPHEKLQCKDYGYRDVKGLLANIPVVEKVGGKNSTKYVLKTDVDFVKEKEPREVEEGRVPQRLDIGNLVSGEFKPDTMQPAIISTGLSGVKLDSDRCSEPSRLVRQAQAPGNWGTGPAQAWDYGWQQDAGSRVPPSMPPFLGAADLQSQYRVNAQQQYLQQSHMQLPMQQPLLDMPSVAERTRSTPQPQHDPRYGQQMQAEDLMRLQQQVQQRLIQEQQRQQRQLLQQQLETIHRPPAPAATSFPSQLSREQYQPPPQDHLQPYWGAQPGDKDASCPRSTGQDVQAKGPEQIDQAPAGEDASLHLDLLLRASSKSLDDAVPRPAFEDSPATVQTRASRLDRPRKSASAFVTSPATLRNADEDTCWHCNIADGEGHLETLQNDRNCMLVHFANGRILFSNACCDRLFSPLTPLRHREVTEIIAEEDRVNFSSRIMYLSIGKFTVMEKSTFKIITAKGVVPANIFGEHLMGSVWWMDCELLEDEEEEA
ncbi:unnamed protein product [Effrenium voratum]|nr:unnamed protein product [Effrenium voratum]